MSAAIEYARSLMACGFSAVEACDTAAMYHRLDEYQTEDLRRKVQ